MLNKNLLLGLGLGYLAARGSRRNPSEYEEARRRAYLNPDDIMAQQRLATILRRMPDFIQASEGERLRVMDKGLYDKRAREVEKLWQEVDKYEGPGFIDPEDGAWEYFPDADRFALIHLRKESSDVTHVLYMLDWLKARLSLELFLQTNDQEYYDNVARYIEEYNIDPYSLMESDFGGELTVSNFNLLYYLSNKGKKNIALRVEWPKIPPSELIDRLREISDEPTPQFIHGDNLGRIVSRDDQ